MFRFVVKNSSVKNERLYVIQKGSTVNITKGSTLNPHAQKAKGAHEKRSEGLTRVPNSVW